MELNELQDSIEYVAKKEGKLFVEGSVTSYVMCVKAQTDYYKAVLILSWIYNVNL